MTKSIFHFHRLQFMGPQESFEVSGDYIYSCGSLHVTSLYIGDDNQIHHDGKRKNRFCLLDVEARVPIGSDIMQDIKEPIYAEDIVLEITVQKSQPSRTESCTERCV